MERKLVFGVIGAFFALTFLLYGPSLKNDFVRWDDGMLVYENPAIREISPRTIKHIFTTYDPELYIPLTFITYQVDYAIAGIKPFQYHLVNLVLHTLNALLVAALAWFVFRKEDAPTGRPYHGRAGPAILCGLLFAVHPLHTEAVEWVSARKDVLSTFFFLFSLVGYLHFRETDEARSYWGSVIAFALGLLSKVMVITLPVILILFDLRDGRKPWKGDALKEKIPYLALSALFGLIAIGGKTGVIQSSTLSAKILMAFKSTSFYLAKIFWPSHLSLLYPYAKPITLASADFQISIVLVILLAGLALWLWKPGFWKSGRPAGTPLLRDVSMGIIFFGITVAPTFVNFAKGGEMDIYFASDRYAYIPSIGIFLAVCASLAALARRGMLYERLTSLFAIVVLLGLSGAAYAQTAVWKNTETLFENVIRHYPESSHVAHNNLGNVYRLRGEYERAIAEYEKAIAIQPHAKTRSNLGAVYRKLGKFDEAYAQYAQALTTDDRSKEAHMGLGLVYAAQGKLSDAEREYRRAIEIDPQYEEAHTNLGVNLYAQKRLEEAVNAYRSALAVNPFFADARYNLAVALTDLQQIDDAVEEYRLTLREVPTFIPARINLGLLLYQSGDQEGAREQFEAILKIDPGNATAKKALQQIR